MKRGFGMRAQISMEYLTVLSFTLVIILGAVYVFLDYTQDSGAEVVSAQINQLGTSLVEQAESLYGIGEDSWTVMDVRLPDEISEIYTVTYTDPGTGLPRSELVVSVSTPTGLSESVFFSDINLTGGGAYADGKTSLGSIFPGKASIKIESRGGYVLLNAS